jgi:hypothetical protein
MLCVQSQPQQSSITMMMLMLQPLPLVSLIVGARDHASSSADDVGSSADAYRSAAMLLMLQARLDRDCATLCQSPIAFPPAHLQRKLALIPTMRRMWLLEHAIGSQPPPPPAAFNAGPEREFEFLAARLGLSCNAADACSGAPVMRGFAMACSVHHPGTRSDGTRAEQHLQIELPTQPALRTPPECFSDLLVLSVNAPCSCRIVHRAAVFCL